MVQLLEKRLGVSNSYMKDMELRLKAMEKEVEESRIKLISYQEVKQERAPLQAPRAMEKKKVNFQSSMAHQRPLAPLGGHLRAAGLVRPQKPLGFHEHVVAVGGSQELKRKEGPSKNFRENSNFPFKKNGPPAEAAMREWAQANGYILIPKEEVEDNSMEIVLEED